MATKFSAFNTESTLSSITGLVGYISGSPGSNVKISPADLISGIPTPGLDAVLTANNNGGQNLMELDDATLGGVQLRMSATALTGIGAGANIYYGDGAGSGDFRIEADRTINFHTDSGTVFQIFDGSGNPEMVVSAGSKFRLSGFSTGSILFVNGLTVTENNANFFWDNANNRLGIGTTTPSTELEVTGGSRITGLAGVGTRMVVADVNGDLGTQAIPGGGGSSYWTPRVQAFTPYTAVAGDFIIATVTTTLRVNLPAGASDGDMVGVKYSTQSAPTDTLLVYTDAVGVTIDGVDRSSSPLSIPALQTYYEFIADGGNWFIK